jgi:omega-6 fatty acid desaturase (delta-12 desaturase)
MAEKRKEVELHPSDDLPFTYQQLKDAVPKHCFERNTFTSLLYTFVDLAIATALFYASSFINHPVLPWFAPYILWPIYWACQGCILTGVWVIAHECGHRAFSDNIVLGDIVGLILHSSLLVPYHSWRISHAKHHQNTNSMENDEVFIPYTRSELGKVVPWDEVPGPWSAAMRVLNVVKMLTFGWPAHLIYHATGRKYGRYTSHFDPWSPLFRENQRHLIILSDAALIAVLSGLAYLGATYGFGWLVCVYVIPYLIVNMWLVLITDLQHTDIRLPHFRGADWKWLKGALCTLDRDYGFLNTVFHHIGDTHVAHHVFHTMPHYHAQEALAALKPVLGKYYTRTNAAPGLRGIVQALWDTTTHCVLVENEGGALYYKDR